MTTLSLPVSVPVSQVGRAAHDIGLAGMLGGQLFGRMAMHPAVTEISAPCQRGAEEGATPLADGDTPATHPSARPA